MLYQLSYLGIFAWPVRDRMRKSASYRWRALPCPGAIAGCGTAAPWGPSGLVVGIASLWPIPRGGGRRKRAVVGALERGAGDDEGSAQPTGEVDVGAPA